MYPIWSWLHPIWLAHADKLAQGWITAGKQKVDNRSSAVLEQPLNLVGPQQLVLEQADNRQECNKKYESFFWALKKFFSSGFLN
jgi:hypothetical protein